MTRTRKVQIVAVCLIALLVVLIVVRLHRKPKPVEAPAAAVIAVARGPMESDLTLPGQFQAYQDVDLHAKVSGYIREIHVDIGDLVHKGEVLATLEVPELQDQVQGAMATVRHSQSQIEQAQSSVVSAQSTHAALHMAYTRLQQAADQQPGLIAAQELDDARAKDQESQAQIDVAKAALDAARQQLGVSQADSNRLKTLTGYTYITSPFNGVVTMRYADTGALIQSGTASNTQSMPVVRVAQSDLLRLRMPVPETDVPYITIGGEASVKVQATGEQFTGKIVRFTRALDTSTRTMVTEVDVPNADLKLSPGMYTDTTIQLQKKEDALFLPAQAVVQNGDQAYVLVVNKDNRIEKRAVTIGIQTANKTEILSGVNEGENIVAAGQANYQSGEQVRQRPAFVPAQESK